MKCSLRINECLLILPSQVYNSQVVAKLRRKVDSSSNKSLNDSCIEYLVWNSNTLSTKVGIIEDGFISTSYRVPGIDLDIRVDFQVSLPSRCWTLEMSSDTSVSIGPKSLALCSLHSYLKVILA
jgi:hypothetical protein